MLLLPSDFDVLRVEDADHLCLFSWGRSSLSACARLPLLAPQNELGILEFIHALVETLDKYFENVCELDIMFNLEKAHFILGESAWCTGEGGWRALEIIVLRRTPCDLLAPFVPSSRVKCMFADEMVTNGCIVETNKSNVLKPILLLEKVSGK